MIYRNDLYHFGIKGMRWGIRRYQNPDGSLTEAGKKRYGGDVQRANYDLLKSRHANDIRNQESYKKALKSATEALTSERFRKARESLWYEDEKDHMFKLNRRAEAEHDKIAKETGKQIRKYADSLLGVYGKEMVPVKKSRGITAGNKFCNMLMEDLEKNGVDWTSALDAEYYVYDSEEYE